MSIKKKSGEKFEGKEWMLSEIRKVGKDEHISVKFTPDSEGILGNPQIYRIKKREITEVFHEKFGKCVLISPRKPFVKKIRERVIFTKDSYYRYWEDLIIEHLEINTNILYYDYKFKYPIQKIEEIPEVLERCSIPSAYRFMQECNKSGYIKKLIYDNDRYYAVNPQYVIHGRYLPEIIIGLFEQLGGG